MILYYSLTGQLNADVWLLDGDAFGEVAGLVDIGASQYGNMIGQQLHRYAKDDGCDELMNIRHMHHM